MLSSGDPIFKKKKRKIWPMWLFLPVMAYYVHHFTKEDPTQIIHQNHVKAQEHLRKLFIALIKWNLYDYDANGRKDFPLVDLAKLIETKFVNGEKLELIDQALADSDLRQQHPIPIDGYYFTLTHWEKAWPSSGMVKELQILAKPADMGKTGSCWFYVNTLGQAYYSNFDLNREVPKWPDHRQLDAEIWQKFDFKFDFKIGSSSYQLGQRGLQKVVSN